MRLRRSVIALIASMFPLAAALAACGDSRPAAPPPTPTPEPRFEAPVESMSIPAIRVESAPLVPMGVRNGYMDLPYNPHDIAWYDFTAKPGMGSNAVFSAHLDYIDHGPAVFHDLHELRPGDPVSVRLRDGTRLHYSVTKNDTMPLADLDIRAAVAPTPEEILTLITCSGAFDGQDYSHRVIVLASRTGVEPGGVVSGR